MPGTRSAVVESMPYLAATRALVASISEAVLLSKPSFGGYRSIRTSLRARRPGHQKVGMHLHTR